MEEERQAKDPYEVITPDGEVIAHEDVLFAYTREGRRVIGKEYPNPVPLEAPLGFVPAEPLHLQIRRMVMRELSDQAAAEGFETAEDADDFDVGDDYDPSSPFELDFEPTEPWPADPEIIAREQAAVAASASSGGEGGPSPPSESPPPAAPGAAPAKPT